MHHDEKRRMYHGVQWENIFTSGAGRFLQGVGLTARTPTILGELAFHIGSWPNPGRQLPERLARRRHIHARLALPRSPPRKRTEHSRDMRRRSR